MPWGAVVTVIRPPPPPIPPMDPPLGEDVELSKYVEQVLDKIIFGEEEILGRAQPEMKIAGGIWLPSMEKKKMHVVKSFTSSFIPGYTTRRTIVIKPPLAPPRIALRGNLSLCGDNSGSMGGEVKIESMKTAMIGLIECAKKRNDYISAYLFGDRNITLAEKSMDYYGVQKRISGIKQCRSGTTILLDSIRRAAAVAKTTKQSTTIVITDGVIGRLYETKQYIEQCIRYGPVIFIVIELRDSADTLREMFPDAIVEFFPSISSWSDFAQKLIEIFESPKVQRRISKYK